MFVSDVFSLCYRYVLQLTVFTRDPSISLCAKLNKFRLSSNTVHIQGLHSL